MLPHIHTYAHTLRQPQAVRQVRERCLGDVSVLHYSSCVQGVEGRLTGWLIPILLRRESRPEGGEERGMNAGKERWREREMIVRTHTLTHRTVYCVCLSQWQPVYHVAINLPTITLWCPGWRLRLEFSWHQLILFHGSVSVLLSSHSPDLCCLPKCAFVVTCCIQTPKKKKDFRITFRQLCEYCRL